MTKFAEMVLNELEKKGLKKSDLVRDLQIPDSTVRGWWAKGSLPVVDLGYKVAQYLGVPLEYLLTGEEKQAAAKTPDPLIAKIQKLTEAQKEEVEDLVDVKLAKGK